MPLDAARYTTIRRSSSGFHQDAGGCRRAENGGLNQPILGPWKSSRFFPEFGQKKPRLVDEGLHFWHLVLVTLKVKIIDQGAILQAWDSEISKHQYISHVCWQSPSVTFIWNHPWTTGVWWCPSSTMKHPKCAIPLVAEVDFGWQKRK